MPAEPRIELSPDVISDAMGETKNASGTDSGAERYLTLFADVLECIDCPVCGRGRPAEHPVADDASDDELLCVDCGAAVFVDPVFPVRAHAA